MSEFYPLWVGERMSECKHSAGGIAEAGKIQSEAVRNFSVPCQPSAFGLALRLTISEPFYSS